MESFEFHDGWPIIYGIDAQKYIPEIDRIDESYYFFVCYSQPPQSAAAGQPLGSRLAWTLPTNCSPSTAMAAPATRLPHGPSAASTKVARARREGELTSSALSSPEYILCYFWKNSLDSMLITSPSWPSAGEVSEAALVRDILYVFQGIDGKFIKMSAQDNSYKIDSKVLHVRMSLYSF